MLKMDMPDWQEGVREAEFKFISVESVNLINGVDSVVAF